MGIAVKNLTATPANLVLGANNVTFNYEGFVDVIADNDVSIVVNIEAAPPLVFTATGNKILTSPQISKKKFPVGAYGPLSDTISITVNASGGGTSPCQISFTFTTALGVSLTQSVYIYY